MFLPEPTQASVPWASASAFSGQRDENGLWWQQNETGAWWSLDEHGKLHRTAAHLDNKTGAW